MQLQDYGITIEHSRSSDGILVQQALAGDEGAFEALVCRYGAVLFQLIYGYVGEREEARDVLQQVWLKLYLSLGTLRVQGPIRPWLFKVARNCCVDNLRSRRLVCFSEVEARGAPGEASPLDALPDSNPTPEELSERRDLQRSIRRAILALPRAYRPVVLLYYGNQLNFTEIGKVLDRPGSTVKTQFYRAKPFLRAALTELLRTRRAGHYRAG